MGNAKVPGLALAMFIVSYLCSQPKEIPSVVDFAVGDTWLD